MTTTLERDADRVCGLVRKRLCKGEHIIVDIAGPPASGKSTLAEAVVRKLNEEAEAVSASPSPPPPPPPPQAVLLPMDGYHLDNCILETHGQLARKGAPETFDSNGFCLAVRQLAEAEEESYYPRFDRKMDLAITCSIAVPPDVPVVVVEGNYLLLNSTPWPSLQNLIALTIFGRPSFDALRDRLQQRWIDHGLDREAAMLRATSNDLNALEWDEACRVFAYSLIEACESPRLIDLQRKFFDQSRRFRLALLRVGRLDFLERKKAGKSNFSTLFWPAT